MGRYDGILICSDIDRTLTWSGNNPTPDTCEAIRRFQAEGGRFTVSTGRAPSHLKNFEGVFSVNAPVVAYGGTVVYDTETNKLLRKQNMTFDLPAAFRMAEPWFHCIKEVHLHRFEEPIVLSVEEFYSASSPWKTDEFLKMVLVVDNEENAIAIRRASQQSPIASQFEVCRSWPEGVEYMNIDGGKGSSVLFLKEYLNAHTLICVGDFENDLSMAPAADRMVAVGNATPELKALAHEITVPVWEGALARVIESL
ncbi:MAG: HAD-IIB family hydrolase [Clostridia bacterium]|nr:HAD-IIB family hydrolase [Clostridia bacterium]